MPQQGANFGVEQWIVDLAAIVEEKDRRAFLAGHKPSCGTQTVDSLYNAVVTFAHMDLEKAGKLAQASTWVAEALSDPYAIAQSARAMGHVLYLTGKHKPAIQEYEKALDIFEQTGREVDYARTISGALQSLIYDGQYERAFKLGERARAIFHAHKDRLRLARLDSN